MQHQPLNQLPVGQVQGGEKLVNLLAGAQHDAPFPEAPGGKGRRRVVIRRQRADQVGIAVKKKQPRGVADRIKGDIRTAHPAQQDQGGILVGQRLEGRRQGQGQTAKGSLGDGPGAAVVAHPEGPEQTGKEQSDQHQPEARSEGNPFHCRHDPFIPPFPFAHAR